MAMKGTRLFGMRAGAAARMAGALALAGVVLSGCALRDPCLKYLPASARVVPPSGGGVDTSDYEHAPIAFTQCRARGGNTFAQFELARAYEQGRGVPRDPAQAAKWYRRAAESTVEMQFTPPASGPDAAYGQTIPSHEGRRWPGLAEAQYRLGLMYLEGRGVPQDRAQARKWLERAARQGYPEAVARLKELDAAQPSN